MVFLNKKKAVPLDDIVLISQYKNKSREGKTLIITTKGDKIIEKNSVGVLVRRIEQQKGFLK